MNIAKHTYRMMNIDDDETKQEEYGKNIDSPRARE